MANKFGIREVCDIKFYKYSNGVPSGAVSFEIDTAKTSTIESATTTVYAQGGRGNARRMSWEGERTLTFTVEDALFSKDSLAALIGEPFDANGKISIKDTTTAGTYKIEATTLIRNDEGEDEVATITINKAKLQSNLSLPFSPTGDPLAFTFTFDAFPDATGEFMSITCNHFVSDPTATTKTKVTIIDAGEVFKAEKTGADALVLAHGGTSVTLGGTAITGLSIATTDDLISGSLMVGNGESITLAAGSNTTWYVI